MERESLLLGTDLRGLAPDFLTVPELRLAFVKLRCKIGRIELEGTKDSKLVMWLTKSPWKVEKDEQLPVDSQYWLLLMLIYRFRREEFDRVALNLCKTYRVVGNSILGALYYVNPPPDTPTLPKPADAICQFLGFWTVPLMGNPGGTHRYVKDYNDDTGGYMELSYYHGNIEFFKSVCTTPREALYFIGKWDGFCSKREMSLHFNKFRRERESKAQELLVANDPQCKWMFSGTREEINEYLYSKIETTV